MFQSILLSICSLLFASPYQNGIVGLSIDLPERAMVVATTNTPPSCLLTGGNSSNIWHLRLDRGINSGALTPKQIVEEARFRRDDPEGTKVLQDIEMQIGIHTGWWLLISQPEGEGTAIIGWLAIPAPGNQYVLASILTNNKGWSTDKEVLLRSLRSIVPLDPAELLAQKIHGLDAANSLLLSLNKETLQPLIGFQEWRRILSKPEETISSVDIGYAYISIVEGYASETKNNEDEPSEPEGIVVNVRTRVVPNPETHLVVDTNAQYWMSWDGKESRWWNRVTRWIDRARVIESETGVRKRAETGSPKSTLLVFQEDLMANTIKPLFSATTIEPWLPRSLVWVLGPLFTTRDTASRYEWYMFENTGENRIVIRSDTLTTEKDGTTKITSRFGDGSDIMTTTIDYAGHLVKQEQVGGVTVIGSSEKEVKAIWEARSLW